MNLNLMNYLKVVYLFLFAFVLIVIVGPIVEELVFRHLLIGELGKSLTLL